MLEFLGIFQKLDEFDDLSLGFFHPGHILEGDLPPFLRHQLRPALPEGEGLAAAALHLPHEENPHPQQEQHRKPGDEQIHIPRGFFGRFRLNADAMLAEGRNQFWIFGGISPEAAAAAVYPANVIPLDRYLLHLSLCHLIEKFAETDLAGWSLRPAKNIKEGDHD